MESEEIPADEEHALQELTYQEAAEMMGKLSPELKRLVRADRKNAKKPFPEEQWWLLYDSVLRKLDPDGEIRLEQVLDLRNAGNNGRNTSLDCSYQSWRIDILRTCAGSSGRLPAEGLRSRQ